MIRGAWMGVACKYAGGQRFGCPLISRTIDIWAPEWASPAQALIPKMSHMSRKGTWVNMGHVIGPPKQARHPFLPIISHKAVSMNNGRCLCRQAGGQAFG